jgi:hypothetical protein
MTVSLKPIPGNERLANGLAILQHLRDDAHEPAEGFPTGTRFTPSGTDGDVLKVIAQTPEGVDTVERISRASCASGRSCVGSNRSCR